MLLRLIEAPVIHGKAVHDEDPDHDVHERPHGCDGSHQVAETVRRAAPMMPIQRASCDRLYTLKAAYNRMAPTITYTQP